MAMGNKNYQNHRKSGIIRTDGVAPKKHLGQHFLKDENVAKRIGETLSMQGYDCVLEIGPGTGVLTKYLLGKGKHILAMELDPESVAFLQESFRTAQSEALKREGGFTVVQADFLKANLHQLFDGAPFAITGNFPYNISSQIVFKAIENRHLIPEFSGMFQKEVAQRICASEGSKTYGILSVLTQVYYEATYLFTVPPEVFNPPPKVESGVIRLVRKEQLQLPCDEKLLIQVVKTAFQQRRKTLRNSLKGLDLPPDLKEDSIFDKRPEQLSVQSFMDLTGLIERSRSASE